MKKTSTLATVPANDGSNHQNHKLATTYLDWINDPDSKPIDAEFGGALERQLLTIMPNGILQGALLGQEKDIRQQAAFELLKGYLAGHPELQAARKSEDIATIASCLIRSISSCLKNCKMRSLEKRLKCAERETLMAPEEMAAVSAQDTVHTKGEHEREHLMRQRVAQILCSRDAQQELKKKDISLLKMLLIDEQCREEVAKAIGRSKSWISRRVNHLVLQMRRSKTIGPRLEID